MNKIMTLLILGLISSCGSLSTNKTKKKNIDKEDKTNSWLDNSDFEKKKEIKYSSSKDLIIGAGDDEDVLISESLYKASPRVWSRLDDADDPLISIISLCYSKKFKEAYEKLDESYSSYKKHPSYWNIVGSCFYLEGNLRKALLYYNKARGINSNYSPAINNLGAIYLKQGDKQKALTAFKKANDVGKNARTPKFNISQIYLEFSFYSDAEGILSRLFSKNKEDEDVMSSLAIAKLGVGKVKESLKLFKELDDDYQEDPYIGLAYALALKKDGQTKDAKDVLEDIKKNSSSIWNKEFTRIMNYVNK